MDGNFFFLGNWEVSIVFEYRDFGNLILSAFECLLSIFIVLSKLAEYTLFYS